MVRTEKNTLQLKKRRKKNVPNISDDNSEISKQQLTIFGGITMLSNLFRYRLTIVFNPSIYQ